MNYGLNNRLNNGFNNRIDNKVFALSSTGLALIIFAFTSIGIIIIDKILPIVDGTLRSEMLLEADAGMVTVMISVLAAIIALTCISYLLMAFLGVNAIRLARGSDGVKVRTGLAKLIVIVGAVSLVSNIASMIESGNLSENLTLLFPAIVQISFATYYISEADKL